MLGSHGDRRSGGDANIGTGDGSSERGERSACLGEPAIAERVERGDGHLRIRVRVPRMATGAQWANGGAGQGDGGHSEDPEKKRAGSFTLICACTGETDERILNEWKSLR